MVCTVLDSGPFHCLITMRDPKGFKSATKHPGWATAMDDEIRTLQQNQTCDLVSRPTHKNVVGSK